MLCGVCEVHARRDGSASRVDAVGVGKLQLGNLGKSDGVGIRDTEATGGGEVKCVRNAWRTGNSKTSKADLTGLGGDRGRTADSSTKTRANACGDQSAGIINGLVTKAVVKEQLGLNC